MGYQFWEPIPRSSTDSERLVPYIASQVAIEHDLGDLADVNVPAPADGEVLTWDAATSKWIAAPGGVGNGDLSWARYLLNGRYHKSPLIPTKEPDTGLALVANTLYAVPYPLPVLMVFDRISVYVSTGVAGAIRLGIYDDKGTYPYALVLDAGTIDSTSSGHKVIVMNEVLGAGLYWLVLLANATPSVYCTYNFCQSILGTADGRYNEFSYSRAQAYGALPAQFPTGGAPFLRMWQMLMRRSA